MCLGGDQVRRRHRGSKAAGKIMKGKRHRRHHREAISGCHQKRAEFIWAHVRINPPPYLRHRAKFGVAHLAK